MNYRVVALFAGFVASTVVAQEPRGWNQPMLQPTIPPKVVGARPAPAWRVPLVYPTLPPTVAGKALVKQHYDLFAPQQGTNGLRMTVTNFTMIVPGTNPWQLRGTNFGRSADEEYVHRWKPDLMYPTYPPKVASARSLGLLELP